MVVLVATNPSILISLVNAMISSNAEVSKSGAIFNKIGLLFLFKFCNAANIFLKDSFSCSSRSPGVLGELTFTTK